MTNTIGRNDPCPCGSGKKFKKCCGQSGFGKHTTKVISGGSSSSLLGRITAAGQSLQAAQKEDSNLQNKKIEPKS